MERRLGAARLLAVAAWRGRKSAWQGSGRWRASLLGCWRWRGTVAGGRPGGYDGAAAWGPAA